MGETAVATGSGGNGDYARLLLTSSLLLALFAGLLVVVVWWLRRRRPGFGDGVIQVRAQTSVGLRRDVLVLEVAGKTLLVGVTDGGMNLLSELDAARLPALRPRPMALSTWWPRAGQSMATAGPEPGSPDAEPSSGRRHAEAADQVPGGPREATGDAASPLVPVRGDRPDTR